LPADARTLLNQYRQTPGNFWIFTIAGILQKEENNKITEELKVGRRKEAMEMGKEKIPRPVTMQVQ